MDGRRVALILGALAVSAARDAGAWDTPEHIRFGQAIAVPFEQQLFHGQLPVLAAPTGGPSAFPSWVSAPDFGRGLVKVLTFHPLKGPIACGERWTTKGVTVAGQDLDDDPSSITDQLEWVDCLDTLALNNSHFGEFARNHFRYYHALALEAARRYRASRQTSCEKAAYTLEGWGLHYLTDSTAAGHGFNPPGSYDDQDLMVLDSVTVRLRIHNWLNQHGAHMAGALYGDGTFFGDHSEQAGATALGGKSVPEVDGNAQRELTLRLSRMALGQVIASAECGADETGQAVLTSRNPLNDPRQVFTSDQAMCAAMFGFHWGTGEIWPDVPDSWNTSDLDLPAVREAVLRCAHAAGNITAMQDGTALAESYFLDKHTSGIAAAQQVSQTIDPEAIVELEDLGCGESLPVVPVIAGAKDLCGNVLCEQPLDANGLCAAGLVASGGCCLPAPSAPTAATGQALQSAWATVSASAGVQLGAPAAQLGDSSELLWLATAAGAPQAASIPPQAATLSSPGSIITDADCGTKADVAVYETTLHLPGLAGASVPAVLHVQAMDEALKVQVDGHAVAYLDNPGQPVDVELFDRALGASGEDHVITLTHVNDCGDARPLSLSFTLPDGPPAPASAGSPASSSSPSGGCSTSGAPAPLPVSLLLAAAMIFLVVRRGARRG